MRTIQAKPLTADAFRQYGTFWSAVDGEGYGLGGGFFTFYPDRIAVSSEKRIGFSTLKVSKPEKYIVEELDPVIETHVRSLGTLLASRLLGNVLLSCGYDVKLSEVHGMSQRGGSVVTHVRYGERVFSPVVDKGEADYLVCFEALEAARWLP